MVLPRFKTFCKHPLINLIEILPLAVQWYTVQNVSHKEGQWLIKCSIFLSVWLLLDFKMTYKNYTPLCFCSLFFNYYNNRVAAMLNLGWEHDWKSDLQSDSLVWHSFMCWANGGKGEQGGLKEHTKREQVWYVSLMSPLHPQNWVGRTSAANAVLSHWTQQTLGRGE